MKSAKEIREHLCSKAAAEPDFRARLLASPKSTIEEELSIEIPESFEIKVYEDGPTTAHLVLPPTAKLTEMELQAAQGADGGGWRGW